jgi:hypothetical protein
VRSLRTLWRHRDHLVTEAAKLLQMMQKVLVQMNIYLHLVVADIAGVTGMRILRAIVGGVRDPAVLASHRDRRCHASVEEVIPSLEKRDLWWFPNCGRSASPWRTKEVRHAAATAG